MVRVVGVRFKKAGKVYYFDPADFPIAAGQKVVVETARGVEYGEVAVGLKDVPEEQVVQPLKKVLRIGNEKDAVVAAENKRKESEAFGVAQKKIEGHTLDMNLVDVEYTFDGSKIIFYFTAEGRIDFRELVRDLAGVFRTRIEMRQIGVRDEAKLLGGIGPCGRILCCTSFLGDFAPVSIRMAKDQNLSLNPSKISGLCGRLMCCLRYEQETYEAAKKDPTLAPGYVPPVLIDETVPALDDLEDRPAPIIGVRGGREAGMGARIAQAVGAPERPRREERPTERRAPQERTQQGGERPQGERRREAQPQGGGRPQQQPQRPQAEGQGGPQPRQNQPRQQQGGGERPQGERRREQQPNQPRQQQGGGERPQGERRRDQQPNQPRQQQGGGERPQGERRREQQQNQPRQQQGGGERPQGERRREQQPNQPRQQQQGGGERQQPEGAQRQTQPGAAGEEQQQQRRHHHRGHRRRSGGGGNPGGGGPNPQGGGNSPT